MTNAMTIPVLDPHASKADNARQILGVRIEDLFRHESIIPDATAIEDLHEARIAAKRLRYTLELFPSLLETNDGKLLDQLKLLQDELGELHDADIRIELIDGSLASLSKNGKKPSIREGLEALLARERTERAERHASVVKLWRRLKRGRFESKLRTLTQSQ